MQSFVIFFFHTVGCDNGGGGGAFRNATGWLDVVYGLVVKVACLHY